MAGEWDWKVAGGGAAGEEGTEKRRGERGKVAGGGAAGEEGIESHRTGMGESRRRGTMPRWEWYHGTIWFRNMLLQSVWSF